jgi:actin-related protein
MLIGVKKNDYLHVSIIYRCHFGTSDSYQDMPIRSRWAETLDVHGGSSELPIGHPLRDKKANEEKAAAAVADKKERETELRKKKEVALENEARKLSEDTRVKAGVALNKDLRKLVEQFIEIITLREQEARKKRERDELQRKWAANRRAMPMKKFNAMPKGVRREACMADVGPSVRDSLLYPHVEDLESKVSFWVKDFCSECTLDYEKGPVMRPEQVSEWRRTIYWSQNLIWDLEECPRGEFCKNGGCCRKHPPGFRDAWKASHKGRPHKKAKEYKSFWDMYPNAEPYVGKEEAELRATVSIYVVQTLRVDDMRVVLAKLEAGTFNRTTDAPAWLKDLVIW